MIYRALKRLEKGESIIEAGSLFRSSILDEKSRAILEQRQIIARIAAPPLSELPGWEKYAGKLAEIGILDAEQLLEAENGAIDFIFGPGSGEALKANVTNWLTVPRPKG